MYMHIHTYSSLSPSFLKEKEKRVCQLQTTQQKERKKERQKGRKEGRKELRLMGRAPCCDKANVKKGPWSPEEDTKLKDFIDKFGTGGNWIALPSKAGLKRCGKSCRLRWLNYLRPNIKHGEFSDEEDRVICSLFATIGSRWSIIAAQLPGRTDNDIKNYWNTKLKKKLLGIIANKPNQHQHQHHHHHQQQQQLFFPPTSPLPSFPQDLFSSCSSSSSHHYDHVGGFNDYQSYITSPCGGSLLGHSWGPSSELAPLEYDYEEIKQLISSNYINSTTSVDDPTATISSAAGGR